MEPCNKAYKTIVNNCMQALTCVVYISLNNKKSLYIIGLFHSI